LGGQWAYILMPLGIFRKWYILEVYLIKSFTIQIAYPNKDISFIVH